MHYSSIGNARLSQPDYHVNVIVLGFVEFDTLAFGHRLSCDDVRDNFVQRGMRSLVASVECLPSIALQLWEDKFHAPSGLETGPGTTYI